MYVCMYVCMYLCMYKLNFIFDNSKGSIIHEKSSNKPLKLY